MSVEQNVIDDVGTCWDYVDNSIVSNFFSPEVISLIPHTACIFIIINPSMAYTNVW